MSVVNTGTGAQRCERCLGVFVRGKHSPRKSTFQYPARQGQE